MEANHGKYYLLLIKPEINIQVLGATTKSSTCKMLFGVHVDNKLKFDTNTENIFKKANRKLNTDKSCTFCWC